MPVLTRWHAPRSPNERLVALIALLSRPLHAGDHPRGLGLDLRDGAARCEQVRLATEVDALTAVAEETCFQGKPEGSV